MGHFPGIAGWIALIAAGTGPNAAHLENARARARTPATAAQSARETVTAQTLNRNAKDFTGKQVTLVGKLDLVVGPGAYVVRDNGSPAQATHRVLVLTSLPKSGKDADSQKARAGLSAPRVEEGDQVQLRGRVEHLEVTHEMDTLSPKRQAELVQATAVAMPVIVVAPGELKKMG